MQRAFSAFAYSVAAAFAARVVWLADRGSHFFRDDFAGFYLARHEPWWRVVLTPIDVHFVPLHRAVNELLYSVAPLDFRWALAALLLAHAAGVVGLAATLRRLSRSPLDPLLVALYATNVFLGVLFLWWTSGLHRLPFVALAVFALYHWVGYRQHGGRRSLFASGLCTALAFGFYSKAPLIPLAFLVVELALWPETPPARRRRLLATALGFVAAAGLAAFLARFAADSRFSGIHVDPAFLVVFELRSLAILAEGLLGRVGDGAIPAWALALVVAPVAITSVLRPWNAAIWAAGLALVAVHIAAIGVSHRTASFGLTAAVSYRYYFELVHVVVLTAALALRGLRLPGPLARRFAAGAGRAAAAAAGAGALLGLAFASAGSFRALLDTPRYRQYGAARVFVTNLRAGIAALSGIPRDEIAFVDSLAPDVLTGKSVAHIRRYSDFLTIFGWEGADHPGATRLYQVTDEGVVRRVARPPDAREPRGAARGGRLSAAGADPPP